MYNLDLLVKLYSCGACVLACVRACVGSYVIARAIARARDLHTRERNHVHTHVRILRTHKYQVKSTFCGQPTYLRALITYDFCSGDRGT